MKLGTRTDSWNGLLKRQEGFMERYAANTLLEIIKLPALYILGCASFDQGQRIGANSSTSGRGRNDYTLELSCCHDYKKGMRATHA